MRSIHSMENESEEKTVNDNIENTENIGDLVNNIVNDPKTDTLYLLAQSERGETVGQTLAGDSLTYEENVGLTSAALLDGIARAEKIDSGTSISKFVEDVIEEAKNREMDTTEEQKLG